jgi:putative endopeptidase
MKSAILLSLAVLAASGAAAAASHRPGAASDWGFDLSGMDRAVRPGDDFFAYANGSWADRTAIPPDRSRYGVLDAVKARTDARVGEILTSEMARPTGGGRMANLYRSYLDEAVVERKGLSPVAADLAAIASAADRPALLRRMGQLKTQDVDGLIDTYVSADPHDTRRYVLRLEQSGLELPAREDYTGADAQAAHVRAAYHDYLAAMLKTLGSTDPVGRADAVLNFEVRLADAHWSDADQRDDSRTDTPADLTSLQAQAPELDWTAYLQALGAPFDARLVVNEPTALAAEAKLWAETPLGVLKDWVSLALMKRYAPYLPHAVADPRFAFFHGVLGGAKAQPSRALSGARLVSDELSDDVGRAYVARYFTAADKAGAEKLVRVIKAAYRRRLLNATWLSPETRRLAVAKLDHAEVLIGYPETWRDYGGLVIRPDDLVGDIQRAEVLEHKHQLAKLGHPVDRREWGVPVTAAGGVAEADLVSIGFPAGMLQAPIYDRNADPAVNFGALGAIVGHELSHLFDDQGRKHDVDGRLRAWWTLADVRRYTARADRLVDQYDAYEPLPGLHLNGRVEQGENLADLLGLQVALDGYHLAREGAPATKVDGFTGEQRFFLGFGQLQRTVIRPEALRAQIVGDVHAPAVQRVNTVRNLDGWYTAFGVAPGQILYLAPAARVQVW